MLSFLDTAYYDNVLRSKEYYENPSIELVAERSDQIIGLIDIELDQVNSIVCSGDWYIASGFEKKQSYLHVYPEGRECQIALKGKLEGIMFVSAFAYYVGQGQEKIKSMFSRVHECNLYEYKFDK